jgi:hypothetical protein
VKALFTNCEGIVPRPPNDMFGLTPNGSIQNVAIETPNMLVKIEFVSMSKMEGAQISTPFENHTQGPNKSTIMIFKPSNMFHYLKD